MGVYPSSPGIFCVLLLESELIWGWILQCYWVVHFISCCFMSKLRLLVTFPYPSPGLKMRFNTSLASDAASLLCHCYAACKLSSAHRNRFGNFLALYRKPITFVLPIYVLWLCFTLLAMQKLLANPVVNLSMTGSKVAMYLGMVIYLKFE